MTSQARVAYLPDGREERLGWYGVLVHNRTAAGSLFTLLHLPFMLAFLSLVIIGAMASEAVDGTILALSLAVVALLLYGEHMLDDTQRVGKPWNTVFGDGTLFAMAAALFALSLVIALYASLRYGTGVPVIGVMAGIALTVLYGLEVRGFHSLLFGGIGMGAVTPFSYLAQAIISGSGWSVLTALLLFAFGSCYGYVLLALYESTKTPAHQLFWRLLSLQFLMVYALAAASWAMRG